jgi:hypothetical protein
MAKPTVVSVPVWGKGHFVPMLEAAKRLLVRSGRRFTITVVIIPAPTAQLAAEIDEQMRMEEANDPDVRSLHVPAVAPPTGCSGIEEFVSRYVQLYAPHVRAAVSGLTCPVAAVVFDLFCTTLLDATRELGVPAYVYMITSAAMCALMLRSPALDEEVAGEFEEMEEAAGVDVPGIPPVPPSCLPTGLENRKIQTYQWFLYTGRRYMETNGIIINTVAELEQRVLAAIADGRCTRGIRPPPVYTIGPVIPLTLPAAEQEHECVRWLDSQPPASVLFLCFGGSGWSTLPEAHEIAQSLERSGHRFLWVLRGRPAAGTKQPTDGDLDELLPPGFLERTKDRGLVWPKRAPQKQILAHAAVGGFATHCGWNSILESVWFGVPMLPWPYAAEQHYNAFMLVAEMGAAVAMKVDRKRNNFVEAVELERAVRALMDGGESATKVRDRAVEMKAACRAAVEESGSSCLSMQRLCEALVGGYVAPKC